MPRRPPINPVGYYHIGTRGTYGRTLFADDLQREIFLLKYGRISHKYGWDTLEYVLMLNHHHFVVHLTKGGLSEGMRELHGGYSRWIHEIYGLTGKGHLVRHAFFARELESTADVLGACAYVALNPVADRPDLAPEDAPWCGYRANIGLEHPRRFHTPALLLELFDPRPDVAMKGYRDFVQQRRADRGHAPSPNDGPWPFGATSELEGEPPWPLGGRGGLAHG